MQPRASDQASWSMFIAAHRAQAPRRRFREDTARILAFAPREEVRLWIEHETFGERVSVEFVNAVADIITGLTLVPPPWPRLLILDADAISSTDLEFLAAIRQSGWDGAVIAIGDASRLLQRTLGTDVVLPRTLDCELLRNTMKQLASGPTTSRMRRIAV